MDVITSTITGGAFGVIIYFFICNGEEKTASQISARITGYLIQLFHFARNSIFVQNLLKWEPFSYVSIQLHNRFLYKYGITLVSDAFVLFFISGIAASILFGFFFESVIGLFCEFSQKGSLADFPLGVMLTIRHSTSSRTSCCVRT